jgi:hypothetical protein
MKTNMLLRYAYAMFAVFAMSGVAHAEDWKVTGEFGWFGVGKAYQIEKGHFYWVGEFSGTFFNDKGKGSHFVGITQVNWQDGTTSGYATWNR